ncbi:MAG TPA: glycosyltransferase, partial [Burkholderiales bacterium]|nr:glycosyltransferase [Burkholderiales bacterium]
MRERTKVLHVLTTSAGGLGQSVLTIMTSLDRERYELHAAFGPGYPLDGAFAAAGISTHMLALSRGIHPLQFARTLMQLARIMRRERFDIVHVHGSEAGVLARLAAWLTRVPRVVVELHGYANRDPDSLMERTVYRWIERALDPLTDAYVAVSDAVRRAWVARGIVTHDRVRVIHHGLDLTRYPDRERAPRTSPPLVVGTVCLLEERKGLHALVEAMPRVIETVGDVRFVIAGEGPLKARMQQRIAELGIADR